MSPSTAYPQRLVALAAAITTAIALLCLLASSQAVRALSDQAEQTSRLHALRGEILLHDETLTMSARLAAASGELRWAERYAAVEPQLVAAIDATIELADDPAVDAAVGDTEAANTALVAMERRAFELVGAGAADEATALLSSEGYAREKRRYGDGMERVLELVGEADRATAALERRRLLLVSLGVLGALGALAFLWATVWRRIRRWGRELDAERRRREGAEGAVRALNERLERKVAERTRALSESRALLSIQANIDDLTGLANRRRGLQLAAQVLDEAREAGERTVVASVDIDGFRGINETLGHAAGDVLLARVARRLRGCTLAGEHLARLGGDEFMIVGRAADEAGVEALVRRVRSAFDEPFAIDGVRDETRVAPSVGVAFAPEHGEEPLTLLRNADLAMYLAKDDPDTDVFRFRREIERRRLRRLEIERELARALDDGQFELHYQPKIDLGDGRFVGCEALLRWNHPTLGRVPPDVFVPVAEETGLIVRLGDWVLEEAARQMAAWRRTCGLEAVVAVNVSPLQLRREDFPRRLEDTLGRHGLSPANLQLELTESSLVEDDARTREVLHAVSALGVSLALDDFGTGYSSLSYLGKYPFDCLKIDRSFVCDMLDDPQSASLIDAIVALARSLGLATVGEGAESAEQCEALHRAGCDVVQGHFFARALPPHELARFVKAHEGGVVPARAA